MATVGSDGGSAGTVVDLGTDERRPATLADVADARGLADASRRSGSSDDPPPRERGRWRRDLHQLLALISNTSKHVQVEVPARTETADAIAEMARIAVGIGRSSRPPRRVGRLEDRPLGLDGDRLEGAARLAGAGIHAASSRPLCRDDRTHDACRSVVVALAEVLAGVVALQLLERAPDVRRCGALQITREP